MLRAAISVLEYRSKLFNLPDLTKKLLETDEEDLEEQMRMAQLYGFEPDQKALQRAREENGSELDIQHPADSPGDNEAS